MVCPSCKSERVQSRGTEYGRRRFYCVACGKWFKEVLDYEEQHVGLTEDKVWSELKDRYSKDELRTLATGRGINPASIARPNISFKGEDICIGFCTDTHIGEESFYDDLWYAFAEEAKAEGATLIAHGGDVHEGMSNRPDQVYHLRDVGFSAQMDHAERLFRATDLPIYMIDGNHDRWGVKSSGLFAVRDLAKRFNKPDGSPGRVQFIGSDCGEVLINGTRWMLSHGEDGAAYATSYRPQKMAESFSGGDKPNVLLLGHDHKQGYFFERNIHIIDGGALSYQSAWMRATRKACHTGFWIIHARIRDGEIIRLAPIWYPFYK
jgi:predicted phosphodiesterase